MENFRILLTLVTFHCCFCKRDIIEQAFTLNDIVPKVIEEAPRDILDVCFETKKPHLGNELTPTEVRTKPNVTFESSLDSFYTLVMFDPDAPSRVDQSLGEFLHWMVVNIQNFIDDGDVIAEYVGSAPPKDTDLHRYIFLLYEQPNKIIFSEPHSKNTEFKNRLHFSIKAFAKKYNLGKPVAGNFYQAEYDDSVPDLHKQIGF